MDLESEASQSQDHDNHRSNQQQRNPRADESGRRGGGGGGERSWGRGGRGHHDQRHRGGGRGRMRNEGDFGRSSRGDSRSNNYRRQQRPEDTHWQHNPGPGSGDNRTNNNSNPIPLTELQIDPPYQFNENNSGNYSSRRGRDRSDRDRPFEHGRGRPRRGNRGSGAGGGSSRSNWRGQSVDSESSTRSELNPNAPPFEPKAKNGELEGTSEEVGASMNRRNDRYPNDRRSRGSGKLRESNQRVEQEQSEESNATNDYTGPPKGGKPKNQREVLMDQLSRNVYECMVCCEKMRHHNPIWSCKKCFNVFHLSCIRKWASSSVDDSGWRCPGCQSYYEASPDGYFCFCGKTKNPKSSRYDIPHTCGQTCGKPNPGGLNCTHNCISKCHPGPCPSCEVQMVKYCGCGKTNAQVLCGSKAILCCGGTCNKMLPCGVHKCSRVCHLGDCGACVEEVVHECYCGNEQRKVPCTTDSNQCKSYSCSKLCSKTLSCGMHMCESPCHKGACSPCKTSPEAVISCPCGQTSIDEACAIARIPKRKKCTDPVPTCGKTCLRILPCGGENAKHRCQRKCHLEKECPPCKLISNMRCRCGAKMMEIPCKELRDLVEVTCQKKCNKRRTCGKHKCNTKCCIDEDHVCPIVCQRQLRCGNHSCTRLCHLNPCPPCDIASFDELACECGASVIYPPIPCGTRRPPCLLPCSREHECDHPVHHPCHSETNCPPCTVLTEKWCHGKHELRKNIMCHITEVSCGLKCDKVLPCHRHKCPKICHAGLCMKEDEVCKLPCEKRRKCGHQCGAPCHEDECPDSKCKIMTNVSCPCGRKGDTLVCWRRDIEYDRTVTWEYHKELKRLEEQAKANKEEFSATDSLKTEIMESMKAKIPKPAVLECDKECARLERNKKMAEALQLENADVSTSIGTPNYSEFLTTFAKKNPQFIEMVHKQLTDLVVKAKQSTKKNVTYGFNSMNRDKRHVVHEYSDYFGVLSESFDEEPNRNVVCFASKEKSYLPSVSLVDAVFRPVVRSERLRPNDDISFTPEKRTQIVGPSQWNMKMIQKSSNEPKMVALNVAAAPATATGGSDFPPL